MTISNSNAVTILAKLTLKLSEVSKKRCGIRDGKFEAIFNAHYCDVERAIIDEDSFQLALDENRVAVDLEVDALFDDEECLKLAINECEKQIKIGRALNLIGE